MRRKPVDGRQSRGLGLAVLFAGAFLAASAPPALAESTSATLFVPIVLSSGGAGASFYTSELTLTNRGTTAATVELRYTAAFGGGEGACIETLLSGEQRVIPDAIVYLRGRGVPIPEGVGRGGTLLVRFTGLSSSDAAAATVRTTTATVAPQPLGAAGLSYPGIPPATSFNTSATLYGLRTSADDRSNVAVYNPATEPVTVKVTAFAGDGTGLSVVKADGLEIPGLGWTQLSGILDGTGITNGWVTVEKTGGSGSFGAYGVINDNRTSDGSFVFTVGGTLQGSSLTVPVLVETTAGFSSELVLTNRATVPAGLTLSYVESLAPSLGTGGTFTLDLAPATQLVIPDAIDYLRGKGVKIGARGAGSFAGTLRVSVAGTTLANVFAGARTAAKCPVGGQFGLFTPGIYSGQEASAESFVYGLRADAGNRTNVALVNAGADGGGVVTLEIQAFDGEAGGVARGDPETIALEPGAWHQYSGFLGSRGVGNGWVRVRRLAGSAPWIAYGVVNDGGAPGERTGDGAYVPMVRAAEAPACTWELATLSDTSSVYLSGFAFDREGRPAIAYNAGSKSLQLKLARWDPAAGSWSVQGSIPGSGGFFGFDPAEGGASFISDSKIGTSGTLDLVHWSGSSWGVETIDSRLDTYDMTSSRFAPDGAPSVSYGPRYGGLQYARRNGTSWSVETVDPNGGWFNSLAYDALGNPAIAYSIAGRDLVLARWSQGHWKTEIVETRPVGDNPAVGWFVSLAFDSSGMPVIAHRAWGVGVEYLRWDGTRWQLELVSSIEGSGISLAFDTAGRPVVSFSKSGQLWIAERTTNGEWRVQSMDQFGYGSRTTMALDATGNPSVAYDRGGIQAVSTIGLARRNCR